MLSRPLGQLVATLRKAQTETPQLTRSLVAAIVAALYFLRLCWKRYCQVALTNGSRSCLGRGRSDEGVVDCAICSKTLVQLGKNGRNWPVIRAVFEGGSTRPAHLHCARELLKPGHGHSAGDLESHFKADLQELLDDCRDLLKANPCLRMCHEEWHLQKAARQPTLKWPPEPPKLPPVQAIFALEHVTELRISSCPLFKEVPIGLSRCRGLQTLVFISDGIASLPPELGLLRDLEVLYLNGNFLRKFPKPIADLPNLTELCLDSNRLKEIPPITSSKLKLFTAPANQLTSMHLVASTLDRIEIHGNALQRLTVSCPSRSPGYQPWARIFKLKVMGNKLRQLPQEIGLMVQMQTLYVADNELQSLPESVASLHKLSGIYAYNNAIVDLPAGILLGSSWLNTVLFESNPLSSLSVASLVEDLSRCTRMKLLGLDTDQIRACVDVYHSWQPLPTAVSVGDVLRVSGNSQYYAKLMRASHIKRRYGRSAVGEPSSAPGPVQCPARILVVAFSASQGEPEWLGLLGTLSNYSDVSLQAPIEGPLEDLLSSASGTGDTACKYLWSGCCQTAEDLQEESTPEAPAAELIKLEDFDVLCLVDHRMKWYAGDEDALSKMLTQVCKRYEHKLFLGASMGGFGALLHAGRLASSGLFGKKDALLAFGPQSVLNLATLRPPGEDIAALEALAERMRRSAHAAAEKGAIIEIHCAMDEHLGHALSIPLRDMALHLHPLVPRKPFAKLLHRTNLLMPVIGDAFARLLSPQTAPPLPPVPSRENLHEARVLVARWTSGGRLLRNWTPRFPMLQRYFGVDSYPMPRPGDWFCDKCDVRNQSNQFWCYQCFREGGNAVTPEAVTMTDIGVVRVPSGNTYPRSGDWGCGKCGAACSFYEKTCGRCGNGKDAHVKNYIF